LGVGSQVRLVGLFVKEDFLSGCMIQGLFIWKAKHLDNHGKLFLLALSWEDWDSSKELGQDAAKTPHING
jgi:hypothetical protein